MQLIIMYYFMLGTQCAIAFAYASNRFKDGPMNGSFQNALKDYHVNFISDQQRLEEQAIANSLST
jgi:hypothetical protein